MNNWTSMCISAGDVRNVVVCVVVVVLVLVFVLVLVLVVVVLVFVFVFVFVLVFILGILRCFCSSQFGFSFVACLLSWLLSAQLPTMALSLKLSLVAHACSSMARFLPRHSKSSS